MRVLICEDEALIAMHLEMLVESLGHAVCAIAIDVDEAVAAAAADRPDVVLVDMRLARGTSGIEVARELRRRWDIPAIVISANLDPDTRAALLPIEPLAMISKPILQGDLIRALTKAAERSAGSSRSIV